MIKLPHNDVIGNMKEKKRKKQTKKTTFFATAYREEQVDGLFDGGVSLALVFRGGRIDGEQEAVLLQQLQHHGLRVHAEVVLPQLHGLARLRV